ncbi:uncharacterized protein C8orf88 homolog isoform X6 [Ranitomeya variabilis]|uniref:uncharacterized protein C8orf88 homolog isoform X6 n=1 Tax=Ranitomeya variabilis TaxID=490064 RepID=UPI004056412F
MSRYREAMTHNGGGCEVLLRNNNMEVGRLSRRPLQPARPIRRTIPDRGAIFTLTSQAKLTDQCKDGIKGRITYSRDVLMQISNLSVSKTKPKYLPDLPIIVQDPVLYKAGSQQAAPSGLHGPQVTPSGLHGAQVTPSGLHGPQVTPSGLHGPQVTLSGLHGAPSCAQWSIRRPTVCTFRGWLTEGAAWDPSRSEVSSLHHATDPSVSAHLENTHRSTRL